MIINCKQATELITKSEYQKLSLSERWRLWRHLRLCEFCRLFRLQNKLIGKALKDEVDKKASGLAPEDKEKIINSMNE